MKDKYLWYTDTHLDKVGPITKLRFLSRIKRENPKAIFLTGDISNGLMTCLDLKLLATCVKCPIYFVLGNHDYHFSSFDETHRKIRELCAKHPNLIWLTESGVVPLTDEVAVIGAEGWYDASNGKSSYLKVTPDWFLIKDLRELPTMEARIEAFKHLADKSCDLIEEKLETALAQDYKTIYILTHVPPWKEATRNVGTIFENFWLPYNVNIRLGKTIERVMQDRKKRNVTVLAGHTHTDCWIHVSRNIECKVNKAKYYGSLRNEEHIFI
jgi:predicted MPP superfamily phosphohydrolase